jgi:ABC-type transport system involved in multi-copper enzyme maturation permease subunit
MTYLIWRLHRTHAIVSAVAIAAFVAVLVPTGLVIVNTYNDSLLMDLVQVAALAVPLVLGISWGAPLVAGEFEARTEDFAWTQGVTRRRWVLTNIGWALLLAALWGGALAALFTWWRGPANAVYGPVELVSFDIQGVAPVAYAVFAMALGIAAGAFFRRVVPAITTTFVVFVALRIVAALVLRKDLAVSKNVSPLASVPALSWRLGSQYISPTGAVANGSSVGAGCANVAGGQQGALSCLAAHGYHAHITFLPTSRFWPVQGVESGLFLALALALMAFTFWWVTTREV